MGHYIRLWYHRSVNDTAQPVVDHHIKAMPPHVSWWAPIGSTSELSDHHIEHIGHNRDINLCSWAITFGHGIIEACMTRLYQPMHLTATLCHHMSPDEAQGWLATAHQITISSLSTTNDATNDAHGALHSAIISYKRKWHDNMCFRFLQRRYAIICV